jgi:hypothetical protein
MLVLTRKQISQYLREIMLRRRLGDESATITEVARRTGLHRDTVYQAANGERISEHTQIALSRALQVLQEETNPKTRIMHVRLGDGTPKLGFGIGPVGGRKW